MSKDAYEAMTSAPGAPQDFRTLLLSFPKIDDPEFYRALERRPFPPRDIDI
jgi:hypothetical protein